MIFESNNVHFPPFILIFGPIAIVYAVARVLSWIFKANKIEPETISGVKPKIRPFETRQEFLDARFEMDLETFLEIASVTPTHITRKPEIKPCKFGNKVDVVIKQIGGPGFGGASDIIGLPGSVIGAGGSGGNFPSGMAGGIGGDAGHPGTPGAMGIDVLYGVSVKVGAWYRHKLSGELFCLGTAASVGGWFRGKNVQHIFTMYSEVELAIPKCGESWEVKSCVAHGKTPGAIYRVPVDVDVTQYLKSVLLCGCLVPFEFGMAKSI